MCILMPSNRTNIFIGRWNVRDSIWPFIRPYEANLACFLHCLKIKMFCLFGHFLAFLMYIEGLCLQNLITILCEIFIFLKILPFSLLRICLFHFFWNMAVLWKALCLRFKGDSSIHKISIIFFLEKQAKKIKKCKFLFEMCIFST